MLHTLNAGDEVKVWPRPGTTVHAAPPSVIETPSGVQILPAPVLRPGQTVRWSAWLQEMARQGAVLFSDPSVSFVQATHVRHPHECGPDGKPAVAGGAHSPEELEHWRALHPKHDDDDGCDCGHEFKLADAAKRLPPVKE
jgi:hypothetical protein